MEKEKEENIWRGKNIFFAEEKKNREGTFLAVQDSSISDIVCRSVGRSEPTNNQSLGSIKE